MKETQLLQTQAYDYLIEHIKKGELQPDTIYSLNQLAKESGFSRTPFRDACVLNRNVILTFFPAKDLFSTK